jgi:hypothetical protein
MIIAYKIDLKNQLEICKFHHFQNLKKYFMNNQDLFKIIQIAIVNHKHSINFDNFFFIFGIINSGSQLTNFNAQLMFLN